MIDVHVHLTPPVIIENKLKYFSSKESVSPLYEDDKAVMVSAKQFLQNMDENGVEKALVCGFPWEIEETAKLHNNWLLEQCAKSQGRLLPLIAFNPMADWAYKHAEEFLNSGAFGLGELAIYNSGFNAIALEKIKALGKLCKKLNKPILMHVNEPSVLGHFYPGKAPIELSEIYKLVLELQGVKLILAHFGGALPLMASLKKNVKEALANVRFDTAAMPYIYDNKALKMASLVLGAEYFLLGTDYPLLNYKRYLKYLEDNLLNSEEIKKITSLNVKFFLGL